MIISSFRQEIPSAKHLQRKTAELKAKTHLPPDLVALVTAVAAIQRDAQERVRFLEGEDCVLPPDVLAAAPPADARLQGAPMLARSAFPLDSGLVAALVPDILRVLAEQTPQLAPLAEEAERLLLHNPEGLKAACAEVLADMPAAEAAPEADSGKEGSPFAGGMLARWAKQHPDAPDFLRFVVQSAVMPSLTAAGILLGGQHNKESVWAHGHCPVCGSQPLMGRLTGTEGTRMHTCSFCQFAFRVPRLGCPFCLATPEGGAEYHASEEEPGYLLDVCKACNNYIKIADFRALDRVWHPALDDLASLTLDLYARQMGYTRPTRSAWGF